MKKEIDSDELNKLYSRLNKWENDKYELDKECSQLFDYNMDLHRVIGLMAKEISESNIKTKICNQINKDIFCNNLSDHISDHINCKECIEKYFYGKVLNCHN